jgi:hypothetical protein
MNADSPPSAHVAAPGTEKPRRFRPKLRYELISCGLQGHEILGTDASALRPEDELFARESGGLRWYRCLRCDSWLALPPPEQPARKYPPARDEITLPLRGKPLRDRYVLRLIAVDRALHFLILSALAAAVFLFADNRAALDAEFTRILNDLQGGVGGPMTNCTPSACSACTAAAGPSGPSAKWTPGGPRSSGPRRAEPPSPCYLALVSAASGEPAGVAG